MTYTVYHLLGHIHGTYDSTDKVINAVLTLIPIGTVKQRKLLGNLDRLKLNGYTEIEYNGCCVLIQRTK